MATTAMMKMLLLTTVSLTAARSMTIPGTFDQTDLILSQDSQQQQQQQQHEQQDQQHKSSIFYLLASAIVPLTTAVAEKKPGLTKMKSGYSKVANSQAMAAMAETADITELEESNVIKVTETDEAELGGSNDMLAAQAKSTEAAAAKSAETNGEAVDVRNLHEFGEDQDDEEEDSLDIGSTAGSVSAPQVESSQPITAKVTVEDNGSNAGQPMAAKLTQEDDKNNETEDDDSVLGPFFGSMRPKDEQTMLKMKKKLFAFVEKHMGGVLIEEKHEVRVEQRANGLQDYGLSS